MSEQGQGGGGGNPAAPSGAPGRPENELPLVFEVFEGLNTKPLRPGIKDQEMAWCDGWMPLGPNNLRTLYGIGDAIYTAPAGQTILFFAFGNIAETPYGFALLSNGRVDQFNTETGLVTQVAAAGTVTSPSTIFGFSQWGNQYILMCADQTNGYWIWDGNALFSAGTLGTTVVLGSVGKNYTSEPLIGISTTGAGTSYILDATLNNDQIDQVTVTDPGNGFAINDFTVLTFTGGGSDDTARANATVDLTSGGIDTVVVLNGGMEYTLPNLVVTGGGGGTGAALAANIQAGVISSVVVISPGSGYTSEPTITVTDAHGTDAVLRANIYRGVISTVSVVSAGTGYTEPPQCLIIGDGTGAVLQAQISTAGAVTGIQVVQGGKNYTKALVQFQGGNNAAYGTVSLMPFGVQGTSIETYGSRAWVARGAKFYFSAPSDPSDFGAPTGGGAARSNDSFLRAAYHRFLQSNGFLYLIGDSSINYISGVTTSGEPATTSFNNLNVDPQIGTPWPQSAQVFSRNIVFANSFGVHVSYGGAVQKVSQPLDGIYNTVLSQQSHGTFSGFYPSAAVASLFGIQVYMLLMPIVDPISGQQVNKLLMWDGKKWWTSPQEIDLTFIATQEINSILTAYGTDGASIYPLFQNPSTGFEKIVQSKLWATPSYFFKKTGLWLAGIANFYNYTGTVTVDIDNETGNSTVDPIVAGLFAVWTTETDEDVAWTTLGGDPVTWLVPGLAMIGPQQAGGQVGVLLGMTITTDSKDVALVSMTLLAQNYQSRI